jgi:pyruvate dehydrogenase E1 component beta subunit
VVALAAMVPVALEAAALLASEGLDVTVIDLRTLVPLDVTTVLDSVRSTGWLFTVEENPRLCGWGAEVASIIAEEGMDYLDGPIVRVTTPHQPLPSAENLERLAIPTPERVAETIRRVRR